MNTAVASSTARTSQRWRRIKLQNASITTSLPGNPRLCFGAITGGEHVRPTADDHALSFGIERDAGEPRMHARLRDVERAVPATHEHRPSRADGHGALRVGPHA